MNVLSLCSGIGGFELGLERAGMTVVGQVEIDRFCASVLKKHWPEVPKHDDIRTAINWWESQPRPRVDVVCAGYPCQPFSTAGKMLADQDPRHLWPAVAAVLRALRPDYAVLENVPAHLGLGFDRVLADLADLGFDAEWSIVHAAAVGAPHRRPRLCVLAYTHQSELGRRGGLPILEGGWWDDDQMAHAHRCRTHRGRPTDAVPWACEPDVGRMADGIPDEMERHRLHALGNAVVPQVAELLGRQIMTAAAESAA